MSSKKLISGLLTITLIIGVGIAIYQSAKKQSHARLHKQFQTNSAKSPTQDGNRKTIQKKTHRTQYTSGEYLKQPAKKELVSSVSILPPKHFFDGRLSPQSTLHVIGVYEGEPEKGKEPPPWWSHCKDHNDPKAMAECHSKYAGIRHPQQVSIVVSYTKTPVVLALMAYNPVIWSIDLYEDVKLEGVILAGYHEQKLIGVPSTVPVIAYTRETPDCGNCFRGEGYFFTYKNDHNYLDVAQKLYEITGKQVSSFQGTYKAKSFNITNMSD